MDTYALTIPALQEGEFASRLHSGSIAGNLRHCELAFEQLMLRVRQSRGGQGVSREDIRALVRRVVDAVVQFGVEGGERFIGEVSLRNPADGLSE